MPDIVAELDVWIHRHTTRDADPLEALNSSFDLLKRARAEIEALRFRVVDEIADV